MSTTIEDRLIVLLNKQARLGQTEGGLRRGALRRVVDSFTELIQIPELGRGPFERLTEYTGVSTQRWRKVFHRRQRPTPDMIEALARLLPHYAFWLARGITDATNGHVTPENAQTFPERLHVESDAANQHFRRSLVLFRRLFQEAGVDPQSDRSRMYAAERTRSEKPAADLCKKRGGQTRRAASGHLEARAAGRSTSSHKKLEYLGILKLSRCFGESVTAVPVDR